MPRTRRLILGICLLIVAAFSYQLLVVPETPATGKSPDEVARREVTAPRAYDDSENDGRSAEPAARQFGDPQDCLTLEQLETHPILVADLYRFDAVSASGPSMAAYRNVSAVDLNNLASQGDSAAMSVLGAMSIMRARGFPDSQAVPYLLHEEPGLLADPLKHPLDSSASGHLEEAIDWFYKAALHGRVLALHHIGDALRSYKGGTVELGWIDESEYDSLTPRDKMALLPDSVYFLLAFEIAPELRSGPYSSLFGALIPRSEQQQEILDELSAQFQMDLEAAGRPPISVAASSAPPMEELIPLLCESVVIQHSELSPTE